MVSVNGTVPHAPSISKDVLQQTAGKIGVAVPKHLEDDFTSMLESGKEAMEEVLAMDGT